MSKDFFILFLGFLGGLGLILVGLKYLSTSFQSLFSSWIERIVNSVGQNPIINMLSGWGVSTFIQSGVTTTMMAVSYAGSGLFSLSQLCAFMIGTNLGTVFTPWVFILDSSVYSYYLLGIGAFPMLYAKNHKVKFLSQILFAFGLILTGYQFIDLSIQSPLLIRSLVETVVFEAGWNSYLYYIVLLLCFAFLCVLVRSSVALLAIVMVLVSREVIPDVAGIVAVLGINLGTALPVFIATFKAGIRAKQGAFFHILTQLLALVVVSTFFINFWELTSQIVLVLNKVFSISSVLASSNVLVVPVSHLVLNIVILIFSLVMLKPIQMFVDLIVCGKEKKEPQRLRFLGEVIHTSPNLAIEQSSQELKKLSAMVETIFQLLHNYLFDQERSDEVIQKIKKYEKITDNIQEELSEFLAHIMELSLVTQQGRQVKSYLRITDELESIADSCRDILESATKLNLEVLESHSEYKDLFLKVLTFYEDIFSVLTGHVSLDDLPKELVEKQSVEIKKLQTQALQQVFSSNMDKDAAFLLGDMLMQLELIRSHSKNIYESLS